MHGNKELPQQMNPERIFQGEELQRISTCCICKVMFVTSAGVIYDVGWLNDNDEEEYDTFIFCSLSCVLDALEPDGNA